MTRPFARLLAVASLSAFAAALCACPKAGADKKKESSASSDKSKSKDEAAAGETLDADGPLVLKMNGKDVKFVNAFVSADYQGPLLVTITSDANAKCGNTSGDGSVVLTLRIPKSPDGKWYPNQVIGIRAEVQSKDPLLMGVIDSWFLRVKPGAFKLDDKTLKIALEATSAKKMFDTKQQKDVVVAVSGGGTIEAQTCLDDYYKKTLKAMPTPDVSSVDGPITGTADGQRFDGKTAIAWLRDDKDANRKYISTIEIYDNAGATCEQGAKSWMFGGGVPGKQFSLGDFDVTDQRKITGVPQPVQIGGGTVSPGHYTGSQYYGWGAIVFSKISLKDGGTIEGSFVTDSGKKEDTNKAEEGHIAGTFKAKVCTRDW